ncbi:hypothetical protein SLA2020_516640 [Shorea laevis]
MAPKIRENVGSCILARGEQFRVCNCKWTVADACHYNLQVNTYSQAHQNNIEPPSESDQLSTLFSSPLQNPRLSLVPVSSIPNGGPHTPLPLSSKFPVASAPVKSSSLTYRASLPPLNSFIYSSEL